MKKIILAIDGLIGAGKSTKLQEYKEKYPALVVILEPIDKWMQSELLQNFYKDPKKWAFKLQSYIMDSFKDELEEAFSNNRKCILMERSHLAAFSIFSYLHWKNGLLTDEEYSQLEQQHYNYDRDLRQRGYIFDHIYLDVPLDVAMERLAVRNRGNEKSMVSREYQQAFLNRYEELCLTPYTEEQLDNLIAKFNEMVLLDKLSEQISFY
jgi:deoxyadenosine/deoxycytidine kinase